MIYFDATKFTGRDREAIRSRGIHPCVCETQVEPGETGEDAVRRWARTAHEQRALLALDFEDFPSPNELNAKAGDAKLDYIARMVDVARVAAPTVRIGNYHLPWYDRETHDRDDKGRYHWRGLADRLDYSAPELYVFRGQPEDDWRLMVDSRLERARRFNKPTYGFLNPTYTFAPYGPVPDDLLARSVDYLRDKVDAVIWWGGWAWHGGANGHMVWEAFDPDAAWVRLSKGE